MRMPLLLMLLVVVVLWDYAQNDAQIFYIMNYYVERMLEFLHLA
jgi:hypothetical protein